MPASLTRQYIFTTFYHKAPTVFIYHAGEYSELRVKQRKLVCQK